MYSVINSLVQYQQYSYNPILSSGKTLCPPSPNKCRNLLRLSEMDVQFILMRRSPRQGIGIRGILTDRCKLRGISALMCPHLSNKPKGERRFIDCHEKMYIRFDLKTRRRIKIASETINSLSLISCKSPKKAITTASTLSFNSNYLNLQPQPPFLPPTSPS